MSKHQCSGCHGHCGSCEELNVCPVCGHKGLEVGYETVYSLTKPFIKEQLKKENQYFLCTQRPCKVAYYSELKEKVMLNQINVPIWFKHQKDEYLVCYCRRITLNDIMETVKVIKDVTKESIVKYLNKEEVILDCLHNNPTGLCCDQLFDNAIAYALKQKDINK